MSADVKGDNQPYDDINITPMLDLAYVLLVTFIIMTTASGAGREGDPTVDLGGQQPGQAPNPRRHHHGRRPGLPGRLSGEHRAVADQSGSVQGRQPQSAGGAEGRCGRAQYDKVMEVLEVAKRLDITEIGLATKRSQ